MSHEGEYGGREEEGTTGGRTYLMDAFYVEGHDLLNYEPHAGTVGWGWEWPGGKRDLNLQPGGRPTIW